MCRPQSGGSEVRRRNRSVCERHLLTLRLFPAGAAQTATHCSVFAQLIVKGKVHGVKTFIVPLRNPKTFQLLPGIAIGDIGKKMGRDGIDNGWIQFTNVRVP